MSMICSILGWIEHKNVFKPRDKNENNKNASESAFSVNQLPVVNYLKTIPGLTFSTSSQKSCEISLKMK